MPLSPISPYSGVTRVPETRTPQTADRLEAAFMEQMLEYMGPKARQDTGSGGSGEAQFQSFLNREYARILADRIDLRLFNEDQK